MLASGINPDWLPVGAHSLDINNALSENNIIEIISAYSAGDIIVGELFPYQNVVMADKSNSLSMLKDRYQGHSTTQYFTTKILYQKLLAEIESTLNTDYDIIILINNPDDDYMIAILALWQYLVKIASEDIRVPSVILLTQVSDQFWENSSQDYYSIHTAPSFLTPAPFIIPVQVVRPYNVKIFDKMPKSFNNDRLIVTIINDDDYLHLKKAKQSRKKINEISILPQRHVSSDITVTRSGMRVFTNLNIDIIIDRSIGQPLYQYLGVKRDGIYYKNPPTIPVKVKSMEILDRIIIDFYNSTIPIIDTLIITNTVLINKRIKRLIQLGIIVDNQLSDIGTFILASDMSVMSGILAYRWIIETEYPNLPGIVLAAIIDEGNFIKSKSTLPRELRGKSIIETLLKIWVEVVSDRIEEIKSEDLIESNFVVAAKLMNIIVKVRKMINILKPSHGKGKMSEDIILAEPVVIGIFIPQNVIKGALRLLVDIFPTADLTGKNYRMNNKIYNRRLFGTKHVTADNYSPQKLVSLSCNEYVKDDRKNRIIDLYLALSK